ncbi:MAG: phytanoyl-CoA dioxygenase family protein [Pseudomonadota bacterium]
MTDPSAKAARAAQFAREGVAIVEHVLGEPEMSLLDRLVPDCQSREAGVHLVGDAFEHLRSQTELSVLAAEFCGSSCGQAGMRLIRAIVFDKHETANWFVPWHQDCLREPVGDRASDEAKVETPISLLEQIVTLRVHLDDCTEDDGPIEVVPGSHRNGVLRQDAIGELVTDGASRLCLVARGDIMVMRPLMVHRSQRARKPSRRRVLHLEYLPTSTALSGLEAGVALS